MSSFMRARRISESPITGLMSSANVSPETIRPEQAFRREHYADGSRDTAPPKPNSARGTSDCCRGLANVGIQHDVCQKYACG